MAFLEMLKVFYIESDEGKMLSATIIVFNPITLLACCFLFLFLVCLLLLFWFWFWFSGFFPQDITFSSFFSISLHCPLEGC